MAEPISLTLSAVAAGLVAKSLDRAADGAVDAGAGAVARLVAAVRKRFSDRGDDAGSAALERVEEAADSPSRVRELADAIDRQAVDPAFRAELEQTIEAARKEGVDVTAICQAAFGDQDVQIANVSGQSTVTVSYGTPPAEPERS